MGIPATENRMIKELHFGITEFQTRLAAVKTEMTRRGIDILLLSEPPNQNYLTGYNAYSFYTPQMVIVALGHEQPIWVGPIYGPRFSHHDHLSG